MKPRPTDAEFTELKRKRDEAVRAAVEAICKEKGWDPAKASFHCSSMTDCYCDCPDGPCQHIWNGPEYRESGMSSVTCSRCKMPAIHHDLRCGP